MMTIILPTAQMQILADAIHAAADDIPGDANHPALNVAPADVWTSLLAKLDAPQAADGVASVGLTDDEFSAATSGFEVMSDGDWLSDVDYDVIVAALNNA